MIGRWIRKRKRIWRVPPLEVTALLFPNREFYYTPNKNYMKLRVRHEDGRLVAEVYKWGWDYCSLQEIISPEWCPVFDQPRFETVYRERPHLFRFVRPIEIEDGWRY